eukprot:1461738-Heterocapsa_arctica.AAC.1
MTGLVAVGMAMNDWLIILGTLEPFNTPMDLGSWSATRDAPQAYDSFGNLFHDRHVSWHAKRLIFRAAVISFCLLLHMLLP